jgi:hypothetical protein
MVRSHFAAAPLSRLFTGGSAKNRVVEGRHISFTALLAVSGSRSLIHSEPAIDRCLLASAAIRLASTANSLPPQPDPLKYMPQQRPRLQTNRVPGDPYKSLKPLERVKGILLQDRLQFGEMLRGALLGAVRGESNARARRAGRTRRVGRAGRPSRSLGEMSAGPRRFPLASIFSALS